MSRKEEFTSKFGGTICLGNHKHRKTMPSNQDKLLIHANTLTTTLQSSFSGGLHDAKFGTGFARRQKNQIVNSFSDADCQKIQAHQAAKEERVAKTNEIRFKTLERKLNPAGYNIISGQMADPGRASSYSRTQSLKCFPSALGEEAPARGQATLRETQGRFFTPFPSGQNQEYRQQVLYNEGMLKPRFTGVLEAHKKDLPSYGVEDQFSKSQYMKTSVTAQTGLAESRLPGLYTPRKIPNHPSGNDRIVHSWNTNVDLNNRTLQGIL